MAKLVLLAVLTFLRVDFAQAKGLGHARHQPCDQSGLVQCRRRNLLRNSNRERRGRRHQLSGSLTLLWANFRIISFYGASKWNLYLVFKLMVKWPEVMMKINYWFGPLYKRSNEFKFSLIKFECLLFVISIKYKKRPFFTDSLNNVFFYFFISSASYHTLSFMSKSFCWTWLNSPFSQRRCTE